MSGLAGRNPVGPQLCQEDFGGLPLGGFVGGGAFFGFDGGPVAFFGLLPPPNQLTAGARRSR